MTVEALLKFVPLTVMVNGAPPATAKFGLSNEIVAPLTVKFDALETAPPGFFAVTASVPAVASDDWGMVAAIAVVVPEVTTSGVAPIYGTVPAVKAPPPLVVPAMKLVPLIVIAVSLEPVTTEFGLIDVIAGALTLRLEAADVTPPGFCTVMARVPDAASEAVGTVATIEVAVPAVTVNAVEPA
jgi:hypothetical protein